MRPLIAVPAEPAALLPLLRDALSGAGPAVLPYPLAGAAPRDVPAEVPTRIAVVIETSGTAGAPKRVALSTDALLAAAAATEAALGGPGRWILALPAHYVAGLQVLIRSIAADREPILLSPSFRPAELAEALAAVEGDRRYLSLVPAQLSLVVEAGEADARLARRLSLLDAVLLGGQRTPEALVARADDLGIRVIRTYGSSETAGGVVYDGSPIGTAEVRIEDGEIWISGPSLAEGYLGDPDRTAGSFITEAGTRWYRTGDDGKLTGDILAVTGRRDDVIISGGEKVSLGLVERVVRELPALHDAVVVASADERWGEVPVVVSPRPADLAPVRDAVVRQLGRAAAPAAVHVVDPLPLLSSGKPDRVALRALIATPAIRVSAVVVLDASGRTLLVRKAGTVSYMQPGGKPEAGESPLDAAVRELAEEVGLHLDPTAFEPLGQFRAAAANEREHDVIADVFRVSVDDMAVAPLAELDAAVWVTRSEALALPLAPLTREYLLPDV